MQSDPAVTGLSSSLTAGIMTTRAAARAFFIDGTNRAMFRYTLLNHMCYDMEQVKDTTRPADRIRQDVSRTPGGDSRLFIVEQTGNIKVVSLSSPTEAPIFLDLQDRITFNNEMGLLGLVFHPDYANNGYFYVNYTHRRNTSSSLFTYVSRFQVGGNANVADVNSSVTIPGMQRVSLRTDDVIIQPA